MTGLLKGVETWWSSRTSITGRSRRRPSPGTTVLDGISAGGRAHSATLPGSGSHQVARHRQESARTEALADQFIETERLGTDRFNRAIQWRAHGEPADRFDDLISRHGLNECRRQPNRRSVSSFISDALDELERSYSIRPNTSWFRDTGGLELGRCPPPAVTRLHLMTPRRLRAGLCSMVECHASKR